MTMRVNEVTITRMDGARLSTVTSMTSRRIWPETVAPDWPRSTLIDCAQALLAKTSTRDAATAAAVSPFGRGELITRTPALPVTWGSQAC